MLLCTLLSSASKDKATAAPSCSGLQPACTSQPQALGVLILSHSHQTVCWTLDGGAGWGSKLLGGGRGGGPPGRSELAHVKGAQSSCLPPVAKPSLSPQLSQPSSREDDDHTLPDRASRKL